MSCIFFTQGVFLHRFLCMDVHRRRASSVLLKTHLGANGCPMLTDSTNSVVTEPNQQRGQSIIIHLYHCQISSPTSPVSPSHVLNTRMQREVRDIACSFQAVFSTSLFLCASGFGGFCSFCPLTSTEPARAPHHQSSLGANATYLGHAVSFSSQSTQPA